MTKHIETYFGKYLGKTAYEIIDCVFKLKEKEIYNKVKENFAILCGEDQDKESQDYLRAEYEAEKIASSMVNSIKSEKFELTELSKLNKKLSTIISSNKILNKYEKIDKIANSLYLIISK